MSRTPKTLRITQPGWIGFTGEFGPVQFVNGISVHPVDPVFIDRIAAEIKVVDHETEGLVGAQVRLIESACVSLSALDQLKTATAEDLKPAAAPVVQPPPQVEETIWTQEKLLAVADTDGIKGLREIGDPLGAKGRSIPELIEAILINQDEVRRQAATRLAREV